MARSACARLSRPQMAPQRLEKIESAHGNGMARKRLTPKMCTKRNGAASALAPADLSRRRGSTAGQLEKTESAPGNGIAPGARAPDLAPGMRTARQPNRRKPERRQTGEPPDDARRGSREGNFPPRKPLISHETGEESRSAIRFGDSLGKSAGGAFAGGGDISTSAILVERVIPPAFPPGVIAPSRAAPTKTAGPDVFSASF